jgi:cytochrome c oxidase assembly protein subunit 15
MTAVSSENRARPPAGRWLHRLAVLVVCLVWPLVWVGSLVTTYDAGMAVPDWPGTYGYNMFLYPWETWITGPFDLLIEHGHRLLGALVGFVAIAAVGVAWRSEPRRWVVGLTAVGLGLVILQGVLGGMRVVLGDRTLAMVHGCTAPIVFSLFTGLAVATSRWWHRVVREPAEESGSEPAEEKDAAAAAGRGIGRVTWGLATGLVLASYLQLVLGAQLRHVAVTASPAGFTHTVASHITLAFLVWGASLILWRQLRGCGDLALSRPAGLLIGFLGVQILLGLATWVVNYGFPMWQQWPLAAGYLLQAKGFGESLIVCGHVATGSLILASAVMIWVRCWRTRWRDVRRGGPSDAEASRDFLSSNEAAVAV